MRLQLPIYLHSDHTEGHTYMGQAMGSLAALGGGGYSVGYDAIGRDRSWLIEVEMRRIAQDAEGGVYLGRPEGALAVRVSDWSHRPKMDLGCR